MSDDVIDGRGGGRASVADGAGGFMEADGGHRRADATSPGEGDSVRAGRSGLSQDRLFGLVAGLMILMALYLLINSLVRTPAVAESPPEVELLAPSDGDTLSLPLELRFRPAQALSMQTGGWGASNFHLHVEAGGLELMPGPNDIRPAAGGEYVWTIATLPSGETTLRLFWADAAHRPVVGGASEGVQVLIR